MLIEAIVERIMVVKVWRTERTKKVMVTESLSSRSPTQLSCSEEKMIRTIRM